MIRLFWDETGEEILDPETGETLGNIEFKKADVKVENTMEHMSIAASQNVRSPLFMDSILGIGGLYYSMYRTSKAVLPIDDGDVNPIAKAKNPYIKIGDSVRQRIIATAASEE